jgi:hypothetical protein
MLVSMAGVSGTLTVLLVETCPFEPMDLLLSWAALLKTAGGRGAVCVYLQMDDTLQLQWYINSVYQCR